jgi:hypothetical protein
MKMPKRRTAAKARSTAVMARRHAVAGAAPLLDQLGGGCRHG